MSVLQRELIVALTSFQWVMIVAVIGLIIFLVIYRKRQQ